MADKTILVVPGKKLQVPRILKRGLLVAGSVALTAALVLAIVVSNGFLTTRGRVLQVETLDRLHQSPRHPGDDDPHLHRDRAVRLLAPRPGAEVGFRGTVILLEG